ncbi:MAG: Uma2 family endonuclease [Cyanobacteria bacterium J06635_15]
MRLLPTVGFDYWFRTMTLSPAQVQTDTWVKATWEEFVAAMDEPRYEEGRGYFDNGHMRIEMAPLGAGHARQNSIVSKVISLYAMVRNLRLVEFTNCSFYKTGERGCQPDTAFYIGANFQLPPQNNSPVDVNVFGPPALAIEISGSTFKDDLGAKRLLYERLGVAEYWVVNVAEQDVIAFAIADQRSGEVQISEVLPGLEISLVEQALHRSQTEDDSILMRWLMDTLQ